MYVLSVLYMSGGETSTRDAAELRPPDAQEWNCTTPSSHALGGCYSLYIPAWTANYDALNTRESSIKVVVHSSPRFFDTVKCIVIFHDGQTGRHAPPGTVIFHPCVKHVWALNTHKLTFSFVHKCTIHYGKF